MKPDELSPVSGGFYGTVVRCALVALWMAVSFAAPADSLTKEPVGLGDFFRVRLASDPQIAPDGKRVAYVEIRPDISADVYLTRVRLVSVSDGRQFDVGRSDATTFLPRWSPDGRHLAFVQSGPSGLELLIADTVDTAVEPTALRSLGSLPTAPRDMEWSPDGSRIAFLVAVKSPRRAALGSVPPTGASWAPAPWVFDSGGFQSPGEMLPRDTTSIALFVVDVTTSTVRRVTTDSLGDFLPYTGSGLAWTRDGRHVLAGLQRGSDAWRNLLQSALYSIDAQSGATRRLAGESLGVNFLPSVATNGGLAFACRSPTRENLIRFEACFGERSYGPYRSLTPDLEALVMPLRIAPKGDGVFGMVGERGVSRLTWFGLDGKREELARTGGGDADAYMGGGAFSVARDGTVAFLYSDSNTPSEVAVVRRGSPMRVITKINDDLMRSREIHTIDEIVFTPTDGAADVHAFVVKPLKTDPARKPPAIVLLHGGQSSDYGPDFDTASQVFAAHGYLVILPNYRGSGSYGRAFSNVAGSPASREHDVLGAADALVRRYGADPDRLYVMGGSGGALISAWTIGQSTRFRAAVLWYAPVEWWTYAMESATGPTSIFAGFDHAPWEHAAQYLARSPYAYVGNVKTPTMLIVGDQDRITPVSGSIAYFRALQMRNVPSELVVYPGATHGIADRPSQSMGYITETLGWLERNGGPPVVTPKFPALQSAASARE